MNHLEDDTFSNDDEDDVAPMVARSSNAVPGKEVWELQKAFLDRGDESGIRGDDAEESMSTSYYDDLTTPSTPGVVRMSTASTARERWKTKSADRYADERHSYAGATGDYNNNMVSSTTTKPGVTRSSTAATAREQWKISRGFSDTHDAVTGDATRSSQAYHGNNIISNSNQQRSSSVGAVRASSAATAREQWKLRREFSENNDDSSSHAYHDNIVGNPQRSSSVGAVRTSTAATAREQWKLRREFSENNDDSSSHAYYDNIGSEVAPGAVRTSTAATAREQWKLRREFSESNDDSSSHAYENAELVPGAVRCSTRTSRASTAREQWKIRRSTISEGDEGALSGLEDTDQEDVQPGAVRCSTASRASAAREQWKIRRSTWNEADENNAALDDLFEEQENLQQPGAVRCSTASRTSTASRASAAREQWKIRRSTWSEADENNAALDELFEDQENLEPGATRSSSASRASTAREQWKIRRSTISETDDAAFSSGGLEEDQENRRRNGNHDESDALAMKEEKMNGYHVVMKEITEDDFEAHPSAHLIDHFALEDMQHNNNVDYNNENYNNNDEHRGFTTAGNDVEQARNSVTTNVVMAGSTPPQNPAEESLQNVDNLTEMVQKEGKITETRKKKRMCCLAVLVGLLIAVVVVVVVVIVFVVGGGTDSDSSTPDDDSSSTQTILPFEEMDFQIDILPSVNLNMSALLQDPASAQSQALQWLLSDPRYEDNYSNERKLRRFIFATFYFSTNGPNWNQRNSRWLSGTDECEWLPTISRVSLCEELALPNVGEAMHGRIPPELFFLSSLKMINLRENHLYGTLPSVVAPSNYVTQSLFNISSSSGEDDSVTTTTNTLLTSLEYLSLRENSISGSIPRDWFRLRNLTHFDMSMNDISGSIPEEVGFATSLLHLALNQNNLVGTIPTAISLLTNLEHLAVNDNLLTGRLPLEELLSSLPNARHLYFDQNSFTGSVPTSIGSASLLEWFLVNENRLTGTIPTETGQLIHAQVLSLRGNKNIHGTIPQEIQNLNDLQSLLLNDMSLVGPLPLSELQSLTNLRIFHLHNNNNINDDDDATSIVSSDTLSISAASSSPLVLSMRDNNVTSTDENHFPDDSSGLLSLEEICTLFLHATSLQEFSIDCYHRKTITSLSWTCLDGFNDNATAVTTTIACSNFTASSNSLVDGNDNDVIMDACVCNRS